MSGLIGNQNSPVAWIGPTTAPFDWVFENCSHRCSIRSWPNFIAWHKESDSTRARFSKIIFALVKRDRALMDQIHRLHFTDPIIPVGCVLGELWLGHRRSGTPNLATPCFYWWNLQDQILPWLEDTTSASALESLHAKIVGKNEYWQLARQHRSGTPSPPAHHAIVLTSNERSAQPLVCLLSEQGSLQLTYFDSESPMQQLAQWGECSSFQTKLEHLLSSFPASEQVSIWWCGGLLSAAELLHMRQQGRVRLQEKISFLQQVRPVSLGWYTTLADQDQWQMLRGLGFSHLLAPPFRPRLFALAP